MTAHEYTIPRPSPQQKCDHQAVLEDAWRLRSQTKAAALHGITRSRVQQICARASVDIVAVCAEEAAERRATAARAYQEAHDPARWFIALGELARSLGYVPTTTTLFREHRALYANLLRCHGSVAQAVRDVAEDTGLPRQVLHYGAERRSAILKRRWAEMDPETRAAQAAAAAGRARRGLKNYWARMNPDERRAEMQRRGFDRNWKKPETVRLA